MKRTTIFLPEDLHERLRQEAHRSRTSMAALIRSKLEAASTSKTADWSGDDPLLRIAGICRGDGKLTENLDEELYDI